MNDLVTIYKNEDTDELRYVYYIININEYPDYHIFITFPNLVSIKRIILKNKCHIDLILYYTPFNTVKYEVMYALTIYHDTLESDLYKIDNKNFMYNLDTKGYDNIYDNVIGDVIRLPKEVGYEIFNKFREILIERGE